MVVNHDSKTMTPAGPEILWQVEGVGIAVTISSAMLEKLHAALDQAPAEEEFGGILLGKSWPGEGTVRTQVASFEAFPIEYRHGASYTLSLEDLQLLERRLQRLRRSGHVPIGLFRSHRRRGMYLDQRDFELFQQEFRNPGSVFLLVRRDDATTAKGALFVWEENDMRRHASYLEFLLPDAAPNVAPLAVPGSTTRRRAPESPWGWRPEALEALPIPDLTNRISRFLLDGPPSPGTLEPIRRSDRYPRRPAEAVQRERRPEAPLLPDFKKLIPRIEINPVLAAKVFLTVTFPLLAFYAARETASHRAFQAEVARPPAAAATAPSPGPEADRVIAQAMEEKPNPFAEPAAPVTPAAETLPAPRERKPAPATDFRERSESPGGVPIASSPAPKIEAKAGGEIPALPDPPAVASVRPATPVPHIVSNVPAVKAPPRVSVFYKTEPPSSVRNAIQRVFVGRNPNEELVEANPIDHPLPPSPHDAAALDRGNTVEMVAKVDKHGNVVYVKVVDGNRELADASAKTLLRWRFDPARKNGTPVDSNMRIRFEFRDPTR